MKDGAQPSGESSWLKSREGRKIFCHNTCPRHFGALFAALRFVIAVHTEPGQLVPSPPLASSWIWCSSWMAMMLLEPSGWMLYGSLRLTPSRCSAFLQRRSSSRSRAVRIARARGSARAPGGAAWRPLPEVLRNRLMEVPHGGAGRHGDHPGVTDGLVSRQAGGWVQQQQALDKVLGQVGHWGPRLWNRRSREEWLPSVSYPRRYHTHTDTLETHRPRDEVLAQIQNLFKAGCKISF